MGAVLLAALVLFPLAASRYGLSLLLLIYMHVAMAQSWNMVSGYTGYFSLGHGVFFGVGAYAAAQARLRGDLTAASVTVTSQGLPPLGMDRGKAHYRLTLVVGARPIAPAQASRARRFLRSLWPIAAARADGPDGADLEVARVSRSGACHCRRRTRATSWPRRRARC